MAIINNHDKMNVDNNQNKKSIITMFSFLFLFLVSLNTIFAEDLGAHVFVNLLNQDPDPVKAGSDFEVRFSIENRGGEAKTDYVIEVIPTYPFEIFPDESNVKEIGTIFPYTDKDKNSANIVKFKLRVKDKIEAGNYDLKIKTYQKGKESFASQKEVSIKIDSESNAEISSINVDSLVPGEKTKLSFSIKNVGKSKLENLMFKWESKDDIILPVGSSNVRYIEDIDVGQEAVVDFYVVSDLNTEPSLYKLDLTLEYDDIENLQRITEAGTIDTQSRRTVMSKAGIYVGGGTDFEVSFSEILRGESSFSIANIGSNLASSVVVKIPKQDSWIVEGSDSDVVGNVKKGAFGRAEFKLNPVKNIENEDLLLIIEYTDTTGKRQSLNKTISLDNNLFDEKSIGVSGNGANEKKSSIFSWKLFVAIALVVLVGIIVYRKKSRLKNKSKN